jgi:hypothetical protein
LRSVAISGREAVILLTTHSDYAMKESACSRHSHQRGTFCASSGLAKDENTLWIAAELCNVVAHPFKRQEEVEHTGIA